MNLRRRWACDRTLTQHEDVVAVAPYVNSPRQAVARQGAKAIEVRGVGLHNLSNKLQAIEFLPMLQALGGV